MSGLTLPTPVHSITGLGVACHPQQPAGKRCTCGISMLPLQTRTKDGVPAGKGRGQC